MDTPAMGLLQALLPTFQTPQGLVVQALVPVIVPVMSTQTECPWPDNTAVNVESAKPSNEYTIKIKPVPLKAAVIPDYRLVSSLSEVKDIVKGTTGLKKRLKSVAKSLAKEDISDSVASFDTGDESESLELVLPRDSSIKEQVVSQHNKVESAEEKRCDTHQSHSRSQRISHMASSMSSLSMSQMSEAFGGGGTSERHSVHGSSAGTGTLREFKPPVTPQSHKTYSSLSTSLSEAEFQPAKFSLPSSFSASRSPISKSPQADPPGSVSSPRLRNVVPSNMTDYDADDEAFESLGPGSSIGSQGFSSAPGLQPPAAFGSLGPGSSIGSQGFSSTPGLQPPAAYTQEYESLGPGSSVGSEGFSYAPGFQPQATQFLPKPTQYTPTQAVQTPLGQDESALIQFGSPIDQVNLGFNKIVCVADHDPVHVKVVRRGLD
eukprot:Blabericola_migrator_1__12864@NODE_837_length_6317_cov_234_594560_g592_i0_p3_GENE_NODE_837_length_6317_cov_234_594560_g592_i0NODE_837_length_6317_cov_234_594560_g592_i0_p3_ORF_typecomplete_len433_score80_76_NODE_837_length_6317_cov_234_594560_g592_i01741472